MITLEEITMGRDKAHPMDGQMIVNLARLAAAVNYIRGKYGRMLPVSSGYRPGEFNDAAGGSKNSAHMTLEAVDLRDPDGEFARWCLSNTGELDRANLYMEDPAFTKGWVHLQTRRPASGNRVFKP